MPSASPSDRPPGAELPPAPPKNRLRSLGAVLLPDSLVWRLFLVFSLSFLAILIVGTIYATSTKQYYLLRGVMEDRARRMADTALLLDTAGTADREIIVERLSVRGLTLGLSPTPPVTEGLTPEDCAAAADMLDTVLNFALEDIWEQKDAENHPWYFRSLAEPTISMGRVAVLSVNVPGLFDDLRNGPSPRPRSVPRLRDGKPLYRAITAIPLSDGNWVSFQDTAPDFRGIGLPPFLGVLFVEIFFVLISLLAFYIMSRPIRLLAQAADNFGRDMSGAPPLPETGPREVRESAQAFNRMQRRIRNFVDERIRTLVAVSHDLRTPLTRMRLRVEELDDAARLPLQKDLDELQQLIDTAMELARTSGTEALAPVDMAALLGSMVEDRQDMGQDVELQSPEKLAGIAPLLALPLSLKRCLGNIMDNAVRYGGGKVTVSAADGKTALTVCIADNGPGIPEEELERVFEPFYRLEPSRSRNTGGSGLGLAIARNMARMHGGDITLANRPQGGLLARVTFLRRGRADAKK
jgi:signal transduction histidine kinase